MTTEKDELDQALERLKRVNTVIKALDDAVKAAAFELLSPMILTADASNAAHGVTPKVQTKAPKKMPKPSIDSDDDAEHDEDSLRSFLATHSSTTPAENVYAIIAWLYNEYGIEPFRAAEVTSLAHDSGITVPARVDMTMTSMKKDGRPLVSKSGKSWRVTVHGETYFKETFAVVKGTKKRK